MPKTRALNSTNHPYANVLRGAKVYRNTGELSFDTRPQSAGTFEVTFLEAVTASTGEYYVRIVNERGMLEQVHVSLISVFNI